jgi:hypothetical protein
VSFLVGQGLDALHSTSQRSVRASLTQRLETEAAKMLSKTYLDRATGERTRGPASHNRESGASGAADDD